MRRFTLLVGSLIAVLAVAQPGTPASRVVIQDELGKHLKVTGWDSWSVKRLSDGTIQITTKANGGGKVTADWISEGNKLVATELVMIATKDYKLSKAEMGGGISFTSRQKTSGGVQTVLVESPKATYTAADGKITVAGNIKLDRGDTATGERLLVSGAGGTVYITDLEAESSSSDPIKSAQVSGPVTFDMKGLRTEDEKKVPFTIKGKSGALRYNREDLAIRLSGGVTISGNDPTLVGDISGVSSAVIQLTKTREVESIEMEGDPGKTIIEQKEKPKTGGGKRK